MSVRKLARPVKECVDISGELGVMLEQESVRSVGVDLDRLGGDDRL